MWEASDGERVAHQVLDSDDESGGKDRGGTLDGERAGLGCQRDQVFGEPAERRVNAERRADGAEQRIERRLTAAAGSRGM